MIGNYFKIFYRNLIKHPGYSISNIAGLAVGMTTCILILLFVHYEMNWDTFNKDADRVCRVQKKTIFKNDIEIHTQTGYQLAPELKKQIPEIEYATTVSNIWDEYLSTSDELTFNERGGYYADNNIFKVLTFHFIKGDPQNALTDPFSVVLTEECANKYFPGQNALGKTIKSSQNKLLKVTGVIENPPFNSSVHPDYIVSMPTFREVTSWKNFDKIENIVNGSFLTYIKLMPNTSLKSVNDKIYNFGDQYVVNNYKKIYLKPITELHLTADERNDVEIALFYIGAFAIFVLMLACINFVNLSTANSFLRKKEIGVRKVIGASRKALFVQYISESLLFAMIAMFLAFLLVEFFLPYYNVVVERQISLNFIRDINFVLIMVGVFVVTGFLSGLYPAMYISGFQPVQIIKGNVSLLKSNKKGTSKSFLRKTLVTVQFCISVLLLTSTVYVVNQVHYMKTKDLGFDKSNILITSVYGEKNTGNFDPLKNQLVNNPDIIDASLSSGAPFHGSHGKEINWEGASPDDKIGIDYYTVDYNFVDTYKMDIVKGRNFSKQFSTDDRACLINETAAKAIGWDNPIGKRIDSSKYTVIGVVKDFHSYTVHVKIPPFCLLLNSGKLDDGYVFAIKVKNENKASTASFVRSTFREYFPDAIIEVTTFDNNLDFGTSGVWEIVEKIFIGFAIIAILIAANGLFGMISFAAQRKMKEIGVRKVFGAGTSVLYYIMSKEFIFILILSALITYPSGYFVTHTTPGAYKYQMGFGDYLFAIIVMSLTAFIATMYHTIKAITANPVDTLRYE